MPSYWNQTGTPMVFTREQLIVALEARIPWATERDKTLLSEHKAAEKAYLKTFRDGLRDALKWDYVTAKKNNWSVPTRWQDRPSCPTSTLVPLQKAITSLKIDHRKSVTISPTGQWSQVYWLLTHDDSIPTEMC